MVAGEFLYPESTMSLTPANIFTDKIPAQISSNPDVASSINAAYVFDVSGEGGGMWTVDLRKDADWVTEGTIDDPGCTVKIDAEDFVNLVTGVTPGPQLFMMGKLQIEGDMGLAMKLGQVFGAA